MAVPQTVGTFVIGLFFLPETKDRDLRQGLGDTAPCALKLDQQIEGRSQTVAARCTNTG
jgi:hypothetical protein